MPLRGLIVFMPLKVDGSSFFRCTIRTSPSSSLWSQGNNDISTSVRTIVMEVSTLLLRLVASGPGGSARVSKRAKGQAEERWTLTHEHLLLFINSRLQLLHEQMMIIIGGGGVLCPRSQCAVAMGNLQAIQSEALWQVTVGATRQPLQSVHESSGGILSQSFAWSVFYCSWWNDDHDHRASLRDRLLRTGQGLPWMTFLLSFTRNLTTRVQITEFVMLPFSRSLITSALLCIFFL